jgi:hypothetical protein
MELNTSVRHFAVCLMPTSVHRDPKESLTGKFKECTYWEVLGPGAAPGDGDCVSWRTKKIQTIDTLLEVGVTTYDNNTLSQESKTSQSSTDMFRRLTQSVHQPLQPFWSECDPLGWNSFDFALRFSCLIPCDTDTKALLRKLGKHVLRVRYLEIVSQISWLRRLSQLGWLLPIQVALTILAPPVVPVVSCSQFVLIWIYYNIIPEHIRPQSKVSWEELSSKLEDMFPRLKGLVTY